MTDRARATGGVPRPDSGEEPAAARRVRGAFRLGACALAIVLVLGPLADAAAQGAKPWRIDLGYAEGANLVLDPHFAEGRMDVIPRLATEIVGRGPHVVVVTGSAEAQAVKHRTSTIPIVMVVVPDPIGAGLVASLGPPGGNVTGLTSTPGLEIQGKRLALLRELAPRATRIGFLVNPGLPATAARVQATEAGARRLEVDLRVVRARTPEELRTAFSALKAQGIDALPVPTDPLFLGERRRLADLARESRVPVMYDVREYVDAAGLASYGPVFLDLFRRAAGYVDKILKGHKPADLPVEQPATFELVISVKVATRLGLTIAPSLLQRADHVLD